MKIKVTLDLKKLTKTPEKIRKNFAKDLKSEIADKIVERIISGKSPVKGKKFEPYADSYAKIKGRKAPVDMLQSGKMLESIRVSQNVDGSIKIGFNDIKAQYHHEDGIVRGGKSTGQPKKVVKRRLLPTARNESFTNEIFDFIKRIARKAVKKESD